MVRIFALFLAVSALYAQISATLVTTDIDNFWRAYDAAQSGDRRSALQSLYFNQATQGLRDFVQVRGLNAANLGAAIDAYPKYYATIRDNTLKVAAQKPLIDLYLSRFLGLYERARFPAVYFLIGRVSTGGTVGPSGSLLIGTEVFSLGGDADPSDLKQKIPAFYTAMGSIDRLPLIVVHELVHTQQRYRSSSNLISAVMLEGVADYLTGMVAGRTINDRLSDYAEAHRAELFQRFAADWRAKPSDYSKWLYNYSASREEPADLGYWIGHEISRDYFTRARDKNAAITALVEMSDPRSIVLGSSYAWIVTGDPPPDSDPSPVDPSADTKHSRI
ncbi:MAG: DUF2268 domain-containing putative Zn-dependent protease [Bryobacteraceae bacterium]